MWCPRAGETRCACSCSPAGCPAAGTRALLTGTLVAEAAGETLLGLGLLALALGIGVGPDVSPDAQTGLIVAATLLTLTGAVLLGRRHPKARRFFTRVKTGCSALKDPKTYARHVLPWQLLSRVLRLAALGCFLAAFHLPGDVRGRPAGHVRAVQRAARAVLTRERRRRRRDPRRHVRPGHRPVRARRSNSLRSSSGRARC